MEELLRYAVENGIIDLRGVAKEVKVQKEKDALNKHHIWQGKNGYFYSKVNGRLIKKKNVTDLYNALIELDSKEQITVGKLYEMFLDNKRSLAPSTISNYTLIFKRYLSEYEDKAVKSITEYDLEVFLNRLIKNGIGIGEFSNFRIILTGIFKIAKKMKLVDFYVSDIIEDMNLSKHDFKKATQRKQVLNNEEYQKITEYLKANLDDINLGLLLILKTGLRVGELAALKPEDIGSYSIKVSRTEIHHGNNYVVANRPKTEAANRTIILADQDLWILKELRLRKSFCEYVFEQNTYQFRKRLDRLCKVLNIEHISPHKLRKTYASRLYQAGVDERIICTQMGHTNIGCTKKFYIKDTFTPEEKRRELRLVT